MARVRDVSLFNEKGNSDLQKAYIRHSILSVTRLERLRTPLSRGVWEESSKALQHLCSEFPNGSAW